MRTACLVLCLAVAASAAPQFFNRFRGGSQATGGASANVISGSSSGLFQNSRVTQLNAVAGGSTSGNGISRNSASATNFGTSGLFGNTDFSNTQAVSNQQSFGGGGFGGGFGGSRGGSFRRPSRRRGSRPNRIFG